MTTPTDLDIEAEATLTVTLGRLADSVNGLRGDLARERRRMPRQLPLMRQSLNNAATFDVLDFGGPANGRMWDVRIIGVFNVAAAGYAVSAAVATVYVGQRMPGPVGGILPVNFVRWQFPSLPGFEDFAGDRLRLQNGENLVIGLTGIPAPPTNIYAMAIINDYPAYSAAPVVGT